MNTRQQNITLIALGGLVVALVATLAYGWHKTQVGLGRDLPCENYTVVQLTKGHEACGNYGLYNRIEHNPVSDNSK